MDYIESHFLVSNPLEWNDILVAELAEAGYESFESLPEGLKGWIPAALFNKETVEAILTKYRDAVDVTWQWGEIIPVNWNEEWEKNYPPVLIGDQCIIRAPFHEKQGNMSFDIVIEPKMSFGTAHHETTRMMIEWLLKMDLREKAVLDMGCGTGILAILAALKGASPVTAIDNYIWAYTNTIENADRNGVSQIKAIHGDVTVLEDLNETFDLLVANINRNVLLEDMQAYRQKLKTGGCLLVSGFFTEDEPVLDAEAQKRGLTKSGSRVLGQWSSVCYQLLS
jgi:ribosomal protein L11 methyltransferase